MSVICPHCNSAEHVSMMVQATIRAPATLAHQFSKKNLRRKDCYLMGVNWETAEYVCCKCNVLIKDGYGDYVSRLEKRVVELEGLLHKPRCEHTHQCQKCHHAYTPLGGESEDCPACGHNGK